MTHLSPPRFTRGEADESERERAREAQLHQPASRERSNNHLGPRGFTPRGADESERKRRTRRSRPAASRERSNYPDRICYFDNVEV